MITPVPINLVFEDYLSKEVLIKILSSLNNPDYYQIGNYYHGRGFGYIKKNIQAFNKAANGMPYLILTDLDTARCASAKIQEWLPVPRNHNLLFRVAIREVESWIIADRAGFAGFLGIRQDLVPTNIEDIPDPKRLLIDLAKKSRKRRLRVDIIPRPGSTAKQGPAYNDRLCPFVRDSWNMRSAMQNSPSLARAVRTLEEFKPHWVTPREVNIGAVTILT